MSNREKEDKGKTHICFIKVKANHLNDYPQFISDTRQPRSHSYCYHDNEGYLMRATPCMTKYTKIGKQVRVRAFVFRIRDQVTVGHVLDCWDFKIMRHQNNWKCRHLPPSVCLCLCESLNSDIHENLDSTPCHHLSHECMSESSIRTP